MKHLNKDQITKLCRWIDNFSGFGIYDADSTRVDWAKSVGIDRPNWPEHTYDETCAELLRRGFHSGLYGRKTDMFVWGNELGRTLAYEFAGYVSDKQNPGAAYWDDLKALRNVEMIALMV